MPSTTNKGSGVVKSLISRIDNIRNEQSLLLERVSNLEESHINLREYMKEQLLQLYSQVEAARETMDELISFMEINEDDEEEEEQLSDDEIVASERYSDFSEPSSQLELPTPEDETYPVEEEYRAVQEIDGVQDETESEES